MTKSNFNIEKAKASVLFIVNNIGETDLLKIFKILYCLKLLEEIFLNRMPIVIL